MNLIIKSGRLVRTSLLNEILNIIKGIDYLHLNVYKDLEWLPNSHSFSKY